MKIKQIKSKVSETFTAIQNLEAIRDFESSENKELEDKISAMYADMDELIKLGNSTEPYSFDNAGNYYTPEQVYRRVLTSRINEVLDVRNMSQYQLAKAAGLNRTAMRNMLNGTSNFTADSYIAVLEALNLKITIK